MLSLQTSVILAPRPGLEPGTCGLTPISRRGVKTANKSLVVLATIVSMVPRCIARHAPVSSLYWLRTESRQTPIRIKHYADCARALVASPPQKNVGTASRPRVLLTVQWLPTAWHQFLAGSPRRRPGFDKRGRRSNVHSVGWFTSS